MFCFGVYTLSDIWFCRCSTQRTPSCSKFHVCMLRRAAVPVAASGIVGRIVFICTHQYSSVFLASGSTISFAKFLSPAVREYPYRRVLFSVLFVPRPSRSVAKLFHAMHHLTSRESQGKFCHSRVYRGFQPLLPFSFAAPFRCYRIIRSGLSREYT